MEREKKLLQFIIEYLYTFNTYFIQNGGFAIRIDSRYVRSGFLDHRNFHRNFVLNGDAEYRGHCDVLKIILSRNARNYSGVRKKLT